MAHTHSQVAVTSDGPSNNTSGGPSNNTSGGPSNNTTAGPSNNTSGGTAISVAQMPSHRHSLGIGHAKFNLPNSGTNNAFISHYAYNNGGFYYNFSNSNASEYVGGSGSHTHTLSSHTHSMQSHTHSL